MQILSQIVEICVFRMSKSKPQYLILQRASNDDLYPNLWQIVTGTIIQSENAIKTALRELKEETGLPVKRFWTVPYVDSYYDASKDAVQLVAVFAAEVDAKSEVHLSSEHQKYSWLKYSDAIESLVWPGQIHVIDIVHDFVVGKKEAARLLEIMHRDFLNII
jgi:8-oxo-dGTP pyrophosphatase MutT (NUDIX family)